jgi:hypothetical protein
LLTLFFEQVRDWRGIIDRREGKKVRNKGELVMFPSKTQLPHYSEELEKEKEENDKFIRDLRVRVEDIMKRQELCRPSSREQHQ